MAAQHTSRVLETILTAKEYTSREDIVVTAQAIVKTACTAGGLSEEWINSYKAALNSIQKLEKRDLREVVGVLNRYVQSACDKGTDTQKAEFDFGEKEYSKGMDFYSRKDYINAAVSFRAAAYAGNAKAIYNYGLCLYNGTGVFKDRAEALKQFVYASDRGIKAADKMLYYIACGGYNGNGS